MSGDKINSLWQTMADLRGVAHFTCSLLSHFCLVFMPLVKALDKHNVDLFQGETKGKI